MFRGLINDAKAAAGSLIIKYVARASVAVPFIVALGFGVAALTLTLADRFGAITAAWMVAGGFTLVGLVATLVVKVKEQEEEVAEEKAEATDTASVATDAAAQAAMQAPLALLGTLFTTSPGTLAGGARLVARNIPLVVLLALIALLFWPTEPSEETAEEATHPGAKPNGTHAPAANGYHAEAA